MGKRVAKIERKTKETAIKLELNLGLFLAALLVILLLTESPLQDRHNESKC